MYPAVEFRFLQTIAPCYSINKQQYKFFEKYLNFCFMHRSCYILYCLQGLFYSITVPCYKGTICLGSPLLSTPPTAAHNPQTWERVLYSYGTENGYNFFSGWFCFMYENRTQLVERFIKDTAVPCLSLARDSPLQAHVVGSLKNEAAQEIWLACVPHTVGWGTCRTAFSCTIS